MKLKYFLFWVPMIPLAFLNAAIRELLLMKYFNYLQAQQLSTLSLTILCGLYIRSVFPSLGIPDKARSLQLGALWVLLTIVFEFSLGIFMHRTWESLLYEYDIFSGKTWPLFLLSLFLLPYVVFKSELRNRR